jgi:hypothetical protein
VSRSLRKLFSKFQNWPRPGAEFLDPPLANGGSAGHFFVFKVQPIKFFDFKHGFITGHVFVFKASLVEHVARLDIIGSAQDLTLMDIADLHEAMIAGRKAWQLIKDGRRKLWADWLVIGSAFQKARTEAMSVANTNQPIGRRYNIEMGRLLEKYDLHDIGKTARACLLKVMDNLADVEEWRSRQPDPDDFNHPTSVWQRFSRSSKAQDHKDKKRLDNSPAALINELKNEIEQLKARNQELEEEKPKKNPAAATSNDEAKMLEAELKAARKRAAALGCDINPIVGGRPRRHWALEKRDQTPCTRTGCAVFSGIVCHDLTTVHAELDAMITEKNATKNPTRVRGEASKASIRR